MDISLFFGLISLFQNTDVRLSEVEALPVLEAFDFDRGEIKNKKETNSTTCLFLDASKKCFLQQRMTSHCSWLLNAH